MIDKIAYQKIAGKNTIKALNTWIIIYCLKELLICATVYYKYMLLGN